MVLTKDNFSGTSVFFRTLPVRITSCDPESFSQAFRDASAGIEKGIVYLFCSEKPVPRLNGQSDILYIGQTKGTFRSRYALHAKTFASTEANKLKYKHILKQYGPIRIAVAPFEHFGRTLLEAEEVLLWWYFKTHCETPPINYTRIKKPSRFI